MPAGWLVLGAVLACLASAAPLRAQEFEFVAPRDGELLAGATDFRFTLLGGTQPERIDVYVAGKLVGAAKAPDWWFRWEAPLGLGRAEIVALAYREGEVVSRRRIHAADIGFSDQIDVVEVELYPVVRDRRGRYVSGLRREDFVVLDQRKPVEIAAFATEVASLNLAILVDTSRSMENDLALVKTAAAQFLDRLGGADEISIYSFNHAVQPLVLRGRDLAAAQRSLAALTAGGGTALYDAILRVLSDLAPIPGRKAVLLFSDGRDERSLSPLARATQMAKESEVIVYAIGREEEEKTTREDLALLAQGTGGEVFFIDKYKELPQVFSAILRDLRAQYRLAYVAPPGPSGLRRIQVQVTREDLSVRCRGTYLYEDASAR